MKVSDYRLGFIGFGHMAQIIFQAIDRAKLIPRSHILFHRRDRDKMRENEREFGITSTSLKNLVDKSDVLILGVRPAQALHVFKELESLDPSKFMISMLAGVKLSYYQKFFQIPLLRVMPNIASEIAMGTTVFTYGPNVSNELRSLSRILFSCMGEVLEVPEPMMDISCGIAGSGPAFILKLIDAMAKEGEKEGFHYDVALKMAAHTFLGAASLVLRKGDPLALVDKIATPHGTTEAGLDTMHSAGVTDLFRKVVQASARRSRELSEEYK